MCKYIKGNQCSILNEQCPYMYFCTKANAWKANNSMPQKCKVAVNYEIPKGYSHVYGERKGYLFIAYNGQTLKILNPFDYVPLCVKVIKGKDGKYKIKK